MRRGKSEKVFTSSGLLEFAALSDVRDLPLLVEIKHRGFWITDNDGKHVSTEDEKCERNSIMLTPDCLLYVYKLAFRHLLLSMRVITPKDIDAANLVPHIKVRKDNRDTFSNYKVMQGKKFKITQETLSVRKDFLTIELDEQKDLHCTMIYSKKVGEKINLLEAFRVMIRVLNNDSNLIIQYANLPDFGQSCAEWWYERGNFPHDVNPPIDFKSKVIQENFDHIKTTPAGSIIE